MPKISELWAWVSFDKNSDDEGVVAVRMPNGEVMPAIGADKDRIESLRPYVLTAVIVLGKPAKLVHFTKVDETEIIQ